MVISRPSDSSQKKRPPSEHNDTVDFKLGILQVTFGQRSFPSKAGLRVGQVRPLGKYLEQASERSWSRKKRDESSTLTSRFPLGTSRDCSTGCLLIKEQTPPRDQYR